MEKFSAELVKALEIMWNYMVLDMPIEKCDLIIGCGCKNLEIPKRCVELLNEGYGENILFCGGFGKITKNDFNKAEAEIYKDIALSCGADSKKIFVENKSTNTGDNFRFGLNVIKEHNLKYDKILIVHNKLSERRTLSVAKAILKNSKIIITSANITKSFEDFIETLSQRNEEDIYNIISVMVGDLQRIIIFPQLGWQIKNDVPNEVIDAYFVLKNLGYNKYIFSKEQIQQLIKENGLLNGKEENYFC